MGPTPGDIVRLALRYVHSPAGQVPLWAWSRRDLPADVANTYRGVPMGSIALVLAVSHNPMLSSTEAFVLSCGVVGWTMQYSAEMETVDG